MENNEPIGIMLLNMGGPDSLDAVEPFLYNLFCDPDIIELPLGFLFQKPLAKWISTRRSLHVREIYNKLGGKSPILDLTNQQAEALEKTLTEHGNFRTFVTMRYWHPFTHDALEKALTQGIRKFLLLPLYPQFSTTTTLSNLHEWERVVKRLGVREKIEVRIVKDYHNHPIYVQAVTERIQETLNKYSPEDQLQFHLLFSAHGVPVKVITKRGDPYEKQIHGTVTAVMEKLNYSHPHYISYQSKVGRIEWLNPSTLDKIKELADQGVTHLLVVPIAFVSDHSETLYEIDIELREDAEKCGVTHYAMMPGLNDSPTFIRALADIVLKETQAWLKEPLIAEVS